MGRFGCPQFQAISDHDTQPPLPKMQFIDTQPGAELGEYVVTTMNRVRLKSKPKSSER